MRLPLLILHILAGSIALLTGTVAMAVRKGGNLHRASGNVFTVAMLTQPPREQQQPGGLTARNKLKG